MPLTPTVYWAQRSDKLYLTIDVQDVKKHEIKLEDSKLSLKGFTGDDDGKEYVLEIEFCETVDAENPESKVSVSPRNIFAIIMKKDLGHWPRLTKAKLPLTHIKADWDKWVDEDEEAEKPEADYSGELK